VLLEALVPDAFDRSHWSPRGLAARFGRVEVEVTVDREDEADYARTFHRRSRTMSLAALVEHIEASADAPRNDLYLVAENRFFERPPLAALLAEIHFPPGWLDDERLRADGASLWLGGAGTRTPLHHDHVNLLACQLHGRKRWRLIAPTERALLAQVERPFTTLDAGALGDVVVKEVIVETGEALFVPAGWWHQVESLAPSTTLSISAFARENTFALRDLTRP
jgi:ribosomal protein L16 Arg81 hydroxylase